MICIIILIVIETLVLLVLGMRMLHDTQKKEMRGKTFAIQNVEMNMDIRVYNAGVLDETRIIIYPHHNWECMTWQMVEREDDSYMLKNLYTEKGFEASGNPADGVKLWQQPLSGKTSQAWIFEKVGECHRIRLYNTELYLTAPENKSNTDVLLKSLEDSDKQLWKLVAQQPIM
ncbi:RICIN domain-containing protein [Clostridium tyrobutyricum]|uniref:RICIN domain-containing protein n=2 Tax=Clostridium tyrobutyricum TaxID=1519 RepID=UPI00073D9D67|nr:RICIN domain-containing protein [Clostridium tyrobutyricum]